MARAEVRVSEFMGPRDPRPFGEARVRFIEHWKELRDETQKAGRLICALQDLIEVVPPGGEATCVPVQNVHIAAYPNQWNAYLSVRGDPAVKVVGTPLRDWAPMPRFMVEEFAYLKIRTVEELSQLPSEALEKWPALRVWAERAVSWLESSETKQADVTKLKRQVSELEAKYQRVLDQNAVLIQRVQEAEGGGIGLVPA